MSYLAQRIKAFTPVSVLLVSAAFKLKELNQKSIAIVCCISLGVAIASYGELEFELIGFLVQVSDDNGSGEERES
jgi:hypothetical protein